MTDTAPITRAPWLEAHDEFEGVGAHELNPRYDHVDGDPDTWDAAMRAAGEVTMATPALRRAQGLLSAATLAAAVPIRLDGADTSHWQYDAGPLDWAAVAAIPTSWCSFKATQSISAVDPTFTRARAETKAQPALIYRGPYHWLSSTTDPEQQAAHYLATIGGLDEGEFAPLDAEEAGVDVDKALGWLLYVEARTRRPSPVYTGAFVAGGRIWTDPRIRESKYGPRPMELAAYTIEAKARALPGVAANPWSSWQYSSNGPVAGVTGRCDMNRVDNFAAFDLAAGRNAAPATPPTPVIPPESTPPPTDQEVDDMATNIVCNAEPMFGLDPTKVKFKVGPDFKLTHLTPTQWKALGSDEGVPLTNAEISELGTA